MARYRMKPVFVEAVRWRPGKPVPGVNEITCDDGDVRGQIRSVEGVIAVRPGDYVVTDDRGDKCAMHPRLFAAIYERA